MSAIIFLFSSEKKKNQYIAPHSHSCWELVWYESGDGETVIGKKQYAFSSNTFALIPPDTLHDERHFQDANLSCIGFDTTLKLGEGCIFSEDGEPLIRRTVERLLREARLHFTDSAEMMSLLTDELVLLLRRREEQKRIPQNELAFAKRFLDENYHTDVSFPDLAKSCGYGYDYFRHRFKDAYGMSPQGYLIAKRLEQAKLMLEGSSKNCTEIAYLCGFSDSAQFSTMFRRAYGISPKRVSMNAKQSPKK